MGNWTPGPWSVEPDQVYGEWKIVNKVDRKFIAWVGNYPEALVLSKAPEMAEALEELLKRLTQGGVMTAAINRANQILKEVEG